MLNIYLTLAQTEHFFLQTYRYSLGFRLSNDPHILQVKVSYAACHRQPAVDIWLSQTVPGNKTPTLLNP